jgi:signal transduction histidine kinase
MAVAGLTQGSEAERVRAPRPAVLWSIALAGCAAGAVSVALALTSDHLLDPGVHAALQNWVTLNFIFAGLVAWSRRPDARLGPLMVAAGFAHFVATLSSANAAIPYTIGTAFDLLAAVLFLHVFLSFPSGRLEGWFERALVAAAYGAAFGLQLVGMALGGFGPDNLLALTAEPEAADALLRVQLVALSACCLVAIGLLAVRRLASGRPLRRRLVLLVDSFALGLLMIAVLFLSGAYGLLDGQLPFETIRRATFFVVGLAPLAFLVGLLHARLERSAVGDLLVGLRTNPPPVELRDALARVLRDPSLTLVYWLPKLESWADLDGRPVVLADLAAGRATTMIDSSEGHVAALLHHPALDDERELLEAVAAAAAIALENARLQVELRARLDDLKRSRARLVEAGDAERRRLERDLHDGAQQRMVGIALQLRLVHGQIRRNPEEAEQLVTTASNELARSLSELRELARGIHPAVLEHGLSAALDALAARSAVPTTVSFEAPGRLPERVEFAAYFVASEALANVAKYARATTATLRVWRAGPMASIEIADDGVGGADDAAGSGLRGLADRVEALDGRLRVISPPGAGTIVTAEMPCGS